MAIPHPSGRQFKTHLAHIAHHPVVTIVTGIALLLAGGLELLEEVLEYETAIGAHHGVMLLGIVTVSRAIAEIVEGVEWLGRGVDEEEEGWLPSGCNCKRHGPDHLSHFDQWTLEMRMARRVILT